MRSVLHGPSEGSQGPVSGSHGRDASKSQDSFEWSFPGGAQRLLANLEVAGLDLQDQIVGREAWEGFKIGVTGDEPRVPFSPASMHTGTHALCWTTC